MRCSYACGSAEHTISRRSFLGTAAGLGLASGFSSMIQPAASAELARRERQVLLIWLHGGASQLETWDPKPARPRRPVSARSKPRSPPCGSRSSCR